MIALSQNKVIFLFNLLPVHKDKVDEDRPSFAIERDCISIVVLPQHLRFQNAGHLLEGPVPGNDFPLPVHSKSSIRQEINDIGQALLRLAQRFLRPLALGDVIENHDLAAELLANIEHLLDLDLELEDALAGYYLSLENDFHLAACI